METIELSKQSDTITVLRLNRPQQRNALSWQLMREFKQALRAIDADNRCRVVDAELAEHWGLVTRLVDDDKLESAALELAESLCDFSPYGLIATKQAMWANLNAASLDDALQIENRNQVLAGLSGDVQEAAVAFFEGRKPDFDKPR